MEFTGANTHASTEIASLAQSVERETLNLKVAGLTPRGVLPISVLPQPVSATYMLRPLFCFLCRSWSVRLIPLQSWTFRGSHDTKVLHVLGDQLLDIQWAVVWRDEKRRGAAQGELFCELVYVNLSNFKIASR
jgi:hypothetical protein